MRSLMACLFVVALFGAGCGDSTSGTDVTSASTAPEADGGDQSQDSDQESESGSSASGIDRVLSDGPLAGDENRPESMADVDFDSPLSKLLGFDFGDTDGMEQEMVDMQRRGEEAIATCMRDQGFEYTPNIIDMGGSFFGGGSDGLEPFTDAWTAKYGFGVSTQRFPQSSLRPGLVGTDVDMFGGPDRVDPNQEYLESLSEGEQEAYYAALFGDMDFGDPMMEGEEPMVFEPQGCQGVAFEESFGGGSFRIFEAFSNEFEDLERRFEADPRILEYHNEVDACLAKGGLAWSSDTEPWQHFSPLVDALQPAMMSMDPFAEAGLNPETMSEREIDEFFAELQKLSPENLDKLEEIQTEEIETAIALTNCGGGELNEMYALGPIRTEYEYEFLDLYGEEIEAFQN